MDTQNVKDIALKHFANRYNCAESVLLGLVQVMDLDSCNIPRIATGFGAGMGRYGEVCGAITGAIMALGLKFGRDVAEDIESRELTYAKIDQLMQAFQNEFKSIRCIDLTGCNMLTQEGREQAKALNLHGDLCTKFVAFAAEKAAQLINE